MCPWVIGEFPIAQTGSLSQRWDGEPSKAAYDADDGDASATHQTGSH
jgi:hypothetical protein